MFRISCVTCCQYANANISNKLFHQKSSVHREKGFPRWHKHTDTQTGNWRTWRLRDWSGPVGRFSENASWQTSFCCRKVSCTVYSLQCQCTVYTVHCTLYTVHCKVSLREASLWLRHSMHQPCPTAPLTVRIILNEPKHGFINLAVLCDHYTTHYTRALHCTTHTSHFTLYTSHLTLHTSNFKLLSVRSTHCIVSTVHRTLHTTHFKLHSNNFTSNTADFKLSTLHCTHLTLHSTHYTSQCTLHPAPCTTAWGGPVEAPAASLPWQRPHCSSQPASRQAALHAAFSLQLVCNTYAACMLSPASL